MLNGDRITLNAIGRLNSDRVFFSKTHTEYVSLFGSAGFGPAFAPEPIEIPDRDYAFEMGLELLSDGDWRFLQAAAHRDVGDTHDGYELYLSYGRTMRHDRWFFEPSIGFSYKSGALNDYYWGVRPEESNLVLPVYEVDAGINTQARLAASYQLTRHWAFTVAARRHERQ